MNVVRLMSALRVTQRASAVRKQKMLSPTGELQLDHDVHVAKRRPRPGIP